MATIAPVRICKLCEVTDPCCGVNVHIGEGGVVLHDSSWPKCHSCGRQAAEVVSLHYRRSDGVKGMSYPMCPHCRHGEVSRLERLGFTMEVA